MFSILCLFACTSQLLGGDWPQILGPNRDGRAIDETLADNWSIEKPTKRWTAKVGEGYAGPAVVGDRLYAFHRIAKSEVLSCLDTNDGQEIWKTSWAASYRGGANGDLGPRCMPTLHEGIVYVFGAAGDLHCVDAKYGKKLWSRRLGRELKAKDGYFGFGSTPILIDGTLLLNVGGSKSASVVGIDPNSGETKWKQFDDGASYSSPTTWSNNGTDYGLFVTRLHAIAIRPNDGKVLLQTPFGRTGATVNAAVPIVVGENKVFLTASYGIGAKLISLETPYAPKSIWESDDVLSSQFPTPVLDGEYLYGIHGREDGPPAALRCIRIDGKMMWERKGIGMAHLILADGKLLMMTVEGELVLLALSSDKYTELGRVTVANTTARALPAFSNGTLFLRTNGRNGELSAWSIPK